MPSTETSVIHTTKRIFPHAADSSQKAFEKKKTIFRFYQVIWYVSGIIETLLLFRFILRAGGANPLSGFVNFVYEITQPFVSPFQGIFPTPGNGLYFIEWSTIIAMAVYLIATCGLIEIFQFVKPVSQEEVEQSVDDQ
jgi:uncharacterized protein YggT (Ycf19 family)